MSTVQRAYSSTVVSPGHVLAGAAVGAVIGAWMFVVLPPSPAGPLVAVVILVTGIYLSTVRLAVGHERLAVGQGPFGPSRVIPAVLIADARAAEVTRPQAFGLGVPWHWRTTRMTVRPGPALVLSLTTGEYIRVSTPDPDAAVAIIGAAGPKESS